MPQLAQRDQQIPSCRPPKLRAERWDCASRQHRQCLIAEVGTGDVGLVANNLDQRAFLTTAVELAVGDMFSRAEIEFAFADGDNDSRDP